MARKPGSKNNAITHGAYAKDLILPGESLREFNLKHRNLIEEWEPVGTLEEDTVLTLAKCLWQKSRADRFYLQELLWAQQHPDEELVNNAIWRAEMLGEIQTVEELNQITDRFPHSTKSGWNGQFLGRISKMKKVGLKVSSRKYWISSYSTS